MPAIDNDKFIVTDQKYNSGFTIDEYNGKISIVNARQADDGRTWIEWCFPQKRKDGENVPGDKALPWKILLGKNREEAIKTWETVRNMLRGENEGNDYNSVPVTDDKDNFIPF